MVLPLELYKSGTIQFLSNFCTQHLIYLLRGLTSGSNRNNPFFHQLAGDNCSGAFLQYIIFNRQNKMFGLIFWCGYRAECKGREFYFLPWWYK